LTRLLAHVGPVPVEELLMGMPTLLVLGALGYGEIRRMVRRRR
jgi:hypothetical protein